MQNNLELEEFHSALIANFRLKAKILSILFGVVLFFQLCAMVVVAAKTDLIGTTIPIRMVVTGPSLLALVFVSEIMAFRYLTRLQGNARQVKNSFIYLSTFVEVSFPCIIMFLVSNFMKNATFFPPQQIINSPLLVIVFIMIILSSLLLDARLAFFAGLVGGIEYLIVNLIIINQQAVVNPVDIANAIVKSLFLVVSGLIAGFVSKKISDAVISSMHAKNELIHHLDKRVAEKTAEIEKKNELLEEKQKEILDSIHYARRIQYTLLPAEKYIQRVLTEIRKGK